MSLSIIALWTASFGQGAEQKIAAELRNKAPDETVDVIVQYHHLPTDAHHQRMLYRGAHLKRTLEVIQAAHYSLSAKHLEAISEDPEVEFISPDRPVYATAYTGNPDYGWKTVGADMATSVFNVDGHDIGVAVIDSGVNSHADLDQSSSDKANKGANSNNNFRVVFRASMIPGLGPDDDYGHGTHVAGIIAGNGTDSTGGQYDYLVRGIAPKVNIVSLRVLDANGAGTDSAVIYAIQAAIALKNQFNIRVINLSLGRPVTTSYRLDPLCLAVQQAWQAGIVVVVAAGNSGRDNSIGTYGYGTITAPGNSPYVITVGAMNTVGTLSRNDDKITSYSSKGPSAIDHIVKPDLVAPGNRIISLRNSGSTLDNTYPGNRVAAGVYSKGNNPNASDYYMLSGTSMAAPMVSGAAVLLLAQNPALTPDQIKARLMKTAAKFAPGYTSATDYAGVTYTSEYDIFTIGAGYLNVSAALGNNDALNGTALSPTAAYDPSTQAVMIGPTGAGAVWGSGAVWGTNAVWGAGAVWGSSVFINANGAVWGSGAVWGTGAVWGSSSPQAFGAVWGTGAVWGSSALSGDTLTVAINGEN